MGCDRFCVWICIIYNTLKICGFITFLEITLLQGGDQSVTDFDSEVINSQNNFTVYFKKQLFNMSFYIRLVCQYE